MPGGEAAQRCEPSLGGGAGLDAGLDRGDLAEPPLLRDVGNPEVVRSDLRARPTMQ